MVDLAPAVALLLLEPGERAFRLVDSGHCGKEEVEEEVEEDEGGGGGVLVGRVLMLLPLLLPFLLLDLLNLRNLLLEEEEVDLDLAFSASFASTA